MTVQIKIMIDLAWNSFDASFCQITSPATSPHGVETLLQYCFCLCSPHGSISDLSRDQQPRDAGPDKAKPPEKKKKEKKGIARFNFTLLTIWYVSLDFAPLSNLS
jgi:hypothetical protein